MPPESSAYISPPTSSDRFALRDVDLNRNIHTLWRMLFVFAGYYAGSRLGFALTFQPYAVSTLWPPNAILLAVLLLSPTRTWPYLILAALPAHLAVQFESHVPPLMLLCWFVSNTCEALIGAGLVRRYLSAPLKFDSLLELSIFLFFVAFLGPFLSSFLDSWFVRINLWGTAGYWEVWKMRFFSNVLAEFTLVPVIISWAQTDFSAYRNVPLRRYVEGILLTVGLFVVTFAVFSNHESVTGNSKWLYLPLPFLLWAASRFGFNVLSSSILMVTIIAIWGAVHGHGPFNEINPVENAFSIQIFLIVFSLPLLLFTSILHEKKKTQEMSLKNEERLRLALSAARMTTWELLIPTNEVIWSTEPNKSHSKLSLEMFLSLVHPDDRLHVSQEIARSISERNTYEIEFRIQLPSGEVMWQLGKGEVAIDERGEPARVLAVNVDMTERKKAEELAQAHRQELYHLSRVGMLGELSGTLAHELNQPLTAILSNAQAALRFLKQDTVDLNELQQILNDVIDQNKRAGNVISRLRALLKKGEVERRPLNLNESVREVLYLAHSELVTHKISVITELDNNLGNLLGDRIQLQQVLLNLVLNAIEAMEDSLDARQLKITTSQTDSGFELSLSDTGTGIPTDKLEEIFEPFYTTKESGLGLGLMISRAIVVAHGGYLQVKNNADCGATFLLSIPRTV